VSLSAHLTTSVAEHGRLAFHPDCPRCRTERLAGSLSADALLSRRAQAALAVGVLTFSGVAPPAVAQVGEVDQEQEGVAAPGGEEPGLEPDFDPGGEDTLDVETGPVQGGPQAGGQDDDGHGAPVDAEPTIDSEAPVVLETPPGPPPAAPTPGPETAPAPTPPVPVTPVEPPAAPPAGELDQPAAPREAPDSPTKRKAGERVAKSRGAKPRMVARSTPAPSVASAPVVQPAATPAPPATVAVSQPSEPADAPVRGQSYTIRAGDSLWSIAKRLLGPEASTGQIAREVDRLWRLNGERIGTGNPSLVHVGTVLRLR